MSIKETLERFDEKKFKIYDTYNNDFCCINDDPLSDDIKQFITEEIKLAMESIIPSTITSFCDGFGEGYNTAIYKIESNISKYFEV